VAAEILKPSALRPVVTSSPVNAQTSTGVSTHPHVETTVFVSMDTSITPATAALDSMQFPSATVSSVMRSTSALSGMVMDLALWAHATT